MDLRRIIIALIMLIFADGINSQELRKFGFFFGGNIPDLSINLGLNYKITDEVEAESEVLLYRIDTWGVKLGGKYFYHLGEKTERPLNSFAAGVSVESRAPGKVTYAIDGVYAGTYRFSRNYYLSPSIGFRYYEGAMAKGLIRSIYIFPIISYDIPFNNLNPELSDGMPNVDISKKANNYLDGGFNITIRAGLVF